MRMPPPVIIDVFNELDDHVAAELLVLLRTLTAALERHYADAVARQELHDAASRQPSLWPDCEPPF